MANDVVWYRYDEVGAPTLNNAAGSLLAVLRACLVSGFRPLSVASIVVAGGVATASVPAGHGYMDGAMVDIAGAGTAAINGRKRITAASAGTFTFPAIGVADGVVSGALTAKRSALGWAEVNAGNVSIFSRTEVGAAAQGLRIDDTAAGNAGTTYARAVGVETWTDVNTYSGLAPTAVQLSGGQYWQKGASSTAAKPWVLVGDGRSFWFFADTNDSGYTSYGGLKAHCFLDVPSYRSGDAYRSVVGGPYSASTTNPDFVVSPNRAPVSGSSTSLMFARRSNGLGAAVFGAWVAFGNTGSSQVPGASGGPVYPSPVDGGLLLQYPTFINEAASGSSTPAALRGPMPGLANPMADLSAELASLHLQIITDSLTGRQFLGVGTGYGDRSTTNNRGVAFLDITGPWH